MVIVGKNDVEKSLSILGDYAQVIGSVRNGTGVEHCSVKTD